MRRNLFLGIIISIALALGFAAGANAQGKGHGVGGGRGASPGGPPNGAGVDRGIDRSSDASMGRADNGRGNASNRSNGRSDAGLERARIASSNLDNADNDLRKHPDIANDLHVNANDLRADYQAALTTNPNLTFGQFVAATRLAANLGAANANITRAAILNGLANGDSLGRTLRNLGLGKDQANAAIKQAEAQNKQSRRRS